MTEETDRILIERLTERVLNIYHLQEQTQGQLNEFIGEVRQFITVTLVSNAEVRTCLKDYGDGEGGLVKQVANNRKKINRLDKTVWGIIIVLSLAGTGNIIGIAKILGG